MSPRLLYVYRNCNIYVFKMFDLTPVVIANTRQIALLNFARSVYFLTWARNDMGREKIPLESYAMLVYRPVMFLFQPICIKITSF